ncbi:MAG TPA: hypothetical protein VN429_11445 [Methanospirillum sp.]|uniref:hypothetical protein n=1 Tax=Methanospirillum sp. TaxID=45200 RepID=UPI002CDD56DA|nr:hypothetical protein [Methanospirillum sp.]HWQ65023.1 hypothetical protein [Methanospirillum sp.]
MIVGYIRGLLLSNDKISTEVGDRIFPLKPPQDCDLPCIVLHETFHQQNQYLDHTSRVQVGVFAESTETEFGYDIAHRIAKVILERMNLYSGTNGEYRLHEVSHIGDTENIAEDPESFAIYSDYYVLWSE